jgi:AmmeMemoRadiSam system protein B
MNHQHTSIRPPAVAGTFYPGTQHALSQCVDHYLQQATALLKNPIKAIISPHAGFQYSGEIAAQAWVHLLNSPIHRFFLLGPSHRLYFNGIAAPSVDYFSTPLGKLRVDREVISSLLTHSSVQIMDDAHTQEHCLETQLPFIQRCTPLEPTIVPLLTCHPDTSETCAMLEPWFHEPGNLLVASSDLSHFHPAKSAVEIDSHTSSLIEHLSPRAITGEQACGCEAINILILLARKLDWRVVRCGFGHSGMASGDMESVVGYGSYLFY